MFIYTFVLVCVFRTQRQLVSGGVVLVRTCGRPALQQVHQPFLFMTRDRVITRHSFKKKNSFKKKTMKVPSLVFDLSIAHDRFGSSSHVQQNGLLTHPLDLDAPLHVAAQRKIAAYQQQYADNQNISFLPAIMSTSTRMHGEFLRLLFLQAHRETEAHFIATGMSSQNIHPEALRFKRAAFYNGLKSKVGLAAAKAAALRINLNVQGCSIVPIRYFQQRL